MEKFQRMIMSNPQILSVVSDKIKDFADEVQDIGLAVALLAGASAFCILMFGGSLATKTKTWLVCICVGVAGLVLLPQLITWLMGV